MELEKWDRRFGLEIDRPEVKIHERKVEGHFQFSNIPTLVIPTFFPLCKLF